MPQHQVNVRYMVTDVRNSIDWYTQNLGFKLLSDSDDLPAEVDRLRARGVKFRNDIVTGPGGSQILLEDPSGNVIELFQPAAMQHKTA